MPIEKEGGRMRKRKMRDERGWQERTMKTSRDGTLGKGPASAVAQLSYASTVFLPYIYFSCVQVVHTFSLSHKINLSTGETHNSQDWRWGIARITWNGPLPVHSLFLFSTRSVFLSSLPQRDRTLNEDFIHETTLSHNLTLFFLIIPFTNVST